MARPRMLGLCEGCGQAVYSTTGYRAITGWVPNRGTGTGGANQVRVIEGHHRFLCQGCYRLLPGVMAKRNRIDPNQMTIDDVLGPRRQPPEVDVQVRDTLL